MNRAQEKSKITHVFSSLKKWVKLKSLNVGWVLLVRFGYVEKKEFANRLECRKVISFFKRFSCLPLIFNFCLLTKQQISRQAHRHRNSAED